MRSLTLLTDQDALRHAGMAKEDAKAEFTRVWEASGLKKDDKCLSKKLRSLLQKTQTIKASLPIFQEFIYLATFGWL